MPVNDKDWFTIKAEIKEGDGGIDFAFSMSRMGCAAVCLGMIAVGLFLIFIAIGATL